MMATLQQYDYRIASANLRWILEDMRTLAGDEVGSSSLTWQDVARNLAANMRDYADRLELAADGKVNRGPAVFPSPDEV